MKLPLLAASLLALGGCVAPGYYVQPDYSGGGYYDDSGYYGGGYYEGSDGYYPGYDDGCCGSASVSIGYGYGYGGYGYGYGGYGYGYPGYYGWSGYPNGYGYYGGGYYGGGYYGRGGHGRGGHDRGGHDRDGHHGGDGGHGGDHHHGQWHGDHVDGAVQRWPSDQRWRDPDRAPIPHWNAVTRSGSPPAPRPRMISPGGAPHFAPRLSPHVQSGAPGRTNAPARKAPHRSDSSSPKEF
jgi:hypothetical protein